VIRPSEIEDLYEMSPLQQGILFHCLAAPDPGLYLITMSYALRGRLDRAEFEHAWQRTVDHNPVLRLGGRREALRLVHREARWQHLDWMTSLGEPLPSALVESERARGVRLDQAPLMRATLVRTGEDRHRLIWSFHHILLEGWSAALVLGEAFTRYEAARRGEILELPARRPYRDYILWLQRDLGRAEAFWRQALRQPTLRRRSRCPARRGAVANLPGSRRSRCRRTLRLAALAPPPTHHEYGARGRGPSC
jgi:hypothetical protein